MRLNKTYKKNIFLLLIGLLAVIIVLITPLTRLYISKIILSYQLGLLPGAVIKMLDEKTSFNIYEEKNHKKSAQLITKYMNFVVNPVNGRFDAGPSYSLLYGNVWCDTQNNILNTLFEHINLKSYLIFLYNNKNISPHTLSFVNFDNITIPSKKSERIKVWRYVYNKLYVMDAQNLYIPILNNQIVNIEKMINNENNFINYVKLDSDQVKLNLIKNKKAEVFRENILKKDSNIFRNFFFNLSQVIPSKFTKKIVEFGIKINPDFSMEQKIYYLGRLNFVFLDYYNANIFFDQLLIDSKYFVLSNYYKNKTFNVNL